ncbi:hypothetical protein [Nocardioides litoris]|uniref:hypothetical protein n=1 Tax=Nocardioides litoris TaxID=1926648 RepID=UPI00111DE2E3|nr:hypothetical protein [Nocardioides litoris]
MTVFDAGTLHRLADDAAGRGFVLEHAATYRRLLPRRVARVLATVLAPEEDTDPWGDCLDAVLSLKVSSTMTGAHELADLASGVEADLRVSDLPGARSQALLLPAAATRAGEAIDAYLARARLSA